jgi:hypothetical protein
MVFTFEINIENDSRSVASKLILTPAKYSPRAKINRIGITMIAESRSRRLEKSVVVSSKTR